MMKQSEQLSLNPQVQKRCRTCGELLPLSRFTKCHFSYYADCKECCNSKKRARYASDAVYRHKQKEASRASFKKAYGTSEGKAKSKLATNLRRSAGTLELHQWFSILDIFDNKCAYCGSTVELEQEHIVPISKGGTTSFTNVVPACRSCNASKGTKDLLDWYPTHKCFSKERLERILSYAKE